MGTGNRLKTFTGRYLDPTSLASTDFDIIDQAHALSMEPRFQGHTPFPYSVAQHAVLVSHEPTVCPDGPFLPDSDGICHAKYKLVHDNGEAYFRDIPTPIKDRPEFSVYRHWEADCLVKILAWLNLSPFVPQCVKEADRRLAVREGIELMNERYPGEASKAMIFRISQRQAKDEYLARFRELFLE